MSNLTTSVKICPSLRDEASSSLKEKFSSKVFFGIASLREDKVLVLPVIHLSLPSCGHSNRYRHRVSEFEPTAVPCGINYLSLHSNAPTRRFDSNLVRHVDNCWWCTHVKR